MRTRLPHVTLSKVKLPMRTRAAVAAGKGASALSRATGRGEGLIIGGKVMMKLAPQALSQLAGDRVGALVSATNGKSSTTRLLAMAMAEVQPVVTQLTGANMTDGVLSALALGARDGLAVLEVDEAYLPQVLPQTRPKALILGNLTRDQLDRMNEVAMLARKWRGMLEEYRGHTTVLANCDDPIVTWAALDHKDVIWVSVGQNWNADASVCLACGGLMSFEGDWHCTQCDFARPQPHWQFRDTAAGFTAVRHSTGSGVGGGSGDSGSSGDREYSLAHIKLPGRFNAANATLALAAAVDVLEAPATAALRGMSKVTGVSGRYETLQIGALQVRLLLAKNPASWSELLTVMPPAPTPVIITINANAADGRDPSWLWDVPFERLRGRTVIVTGLRRHDMAVRLLHANVDHVVVADPYAADAELPAAVRELDVIDCAATYTAFFDLRVRGGVA